MANVYVSNPIKIDTTFTTGWRANQTVYSTATGAFQPGFRVQKVVWSAPGASASFSIQETSDSMILLQGATSASFVGPDPEFDFEEQNIVWRNFKVPTLSAGTLFIFYRL